MPLVCLLRLFSYIQQPDGPEDPADATGPDQSVGFGFLLHHLLLLFLKNGLLPCRRSN